ncbi:hypothetical protein NT04LS_1848 [Listeria seeligeri FSL S4-171]|nr:hypothetical protein NT04LS_1848 [Listeria seeligeri FSL S4-171]
MRGIYLEKLVVKLILELFKKKSLERTYVDLTRSAKRSKIMNSYQFCSE